MLSSLIAPSVLKSLTGVNDSINITRFNLSMVYQIIVFEKLVKSLE